jgi:hypothetical protein
MKVMSGSNYDLELTGRVPTFDDQEDEMARAQQQEKIRSAAEQLGFEPESSVGRLVASIHGFQMVEGALNHELQDVISEHASLQRQLYREAIKEQWPATRKGMPQQLDSEAQDTAHDDPHEGEGDSTVTTLRQEPPGASFSPRGTATASGPRRGILWRQQNSETASRERARAATVRRPATAPASRHGHRHRSRPQHR